MKESGNSWSDSFKRSVPGMGGTPGDAPSSERSLRDALAKVEQILAESQELALIGSWEWDIATGRLAWTAQTFRNFGEDPDSFIPTFENYTERLHPDDREMMMRYELMVAEMRKQAEEFWKPRAEQQRHWRSLVVRENISPVSNASHYS